MISELFIVTVMSVVIGSLLMVFSLLITAPWLYQAALALTVVGGAGLLSLLLVTALRLDK